LQHASRVPADPAVRRVRQVRVGQHLVDARTGTGCRLDVGCRDLLLLMVVSAVLLYFVFWRNDWLWTGQHTRRGAAVRPPPLNRCVATSATASD
jgi:hypothetical protein